MLNKSRAHWFCKACGKHAYGSAGRATQTIDNIKELSGRSVKPVRAYECPYGNGYHLTSKERSA